ncbi:FolC bifunctional protein [Cantharellus anzutake]|uniref:FolC bifunctional protein n=1 Tax=Cantharellus anzutake TaxID=1750568 RepID=UPI001906AFF5|nr:FolC bifunctional protein [Cantharellus anzutake]KAF8341571.1 FolC bifunctional protein [Cantharellus anzutake]
MSSRTYEGAVEKLNTLQSNAATLQAIRASGAPTKAEYAIPEMIGFLRRIGYTPEDLNRLNVIHVTGTKGKGSTCAFVDSLLRHSDPSWKVGLYTSPHLIAVRERIRINGEPISEELFARYFFDVWDRLENTTIETQEFRTPKPMYFKFLTLVAFHVFMELKVDATILEVGVGGTYDSTNIVPKPVATGVSALGIDHVFMLGNTLREIGWQKGGIYKEGVPAFTVEQPAEGLTSLEQQARDRNASSFTVLSTIPQLSELKLGLQGQHQIQNATLAIHLAHHFLGVKRPNLAPALPAPLSHLFITALEKTRWPGRCQAVVDPSRPGKEDGSGSTTWFLDGAHTVESLKSSAEWYFSPGVGLSGTDKRQIDHTGPTRILIFNCTSGRSGKTFLGTLLSTADVLLKTHEGFAQNIAAKAGLFDHVIFCTNITYTDGNFKGDLRSVAMTDAERDKLTPQRELEAAWRSLVPSFPEENVHVLPTVGHAVQVVRDVEEADPSASLHVVVAGSLHLVGGVIEAADLASVALATSHV